jgi:tRNA threonylcarbamoyladenosine biosynthesis protein TsaB
MIILLDTSTPTCLLTLVDTKQQRHEYTWQANRDLAQGLLHYIETSLADFGQSLHDITAIGLMKGPGSFTGLRVGLSVANTLAESISIPIVGTIGKAWQDEAIAHLDKGENQQIVLPEYGMAPNITKPRK